MLGVPGLGLQCDLKGHICESLCNSFITDGHSSIRVELAQAHEQIPLAQAQAI
jgi:hypothetical protein